MQEGTKKYKKRKKVDMRRGVLLLPNLITTMSLFCGYLSITQSLKENYAFAAWLVVLATFLDFLDGRVARMTGSQSDFGAEYDSLSDLLTFVVAPAVLAYKFGLYHFDKFGIAAGFLFVACGALRLARFNVQAGNVEKFDFQGLPSPSAGGTLCTFIIFYEHLFDLPDAYPFILLGFTLGLGLLMVSAVRYRSFKRLHRTSFVFLIMLVTIIFAMATQPQIMFFTLALVYVLSGIVEWIWKSPQKIRGIKDLWVRFYNERNEDLVYDDDGELDDELYDADGDFDDDKTLDRQAESSLTDPINVVKIK